MRIVAALSERELGYVEAVNFQLEVYNEELKKLNAKIDSNQVSEETFYDVSGQIMALSNLMTKVVKKAHDLYGDHIAPVDVHATARKTVDLFKKFEGRT